MNRKVNRVYNYGNFSERHSSSLFTAIIGLVQAYIVYMFSFLIVLLDRESSIFIETAYSFPAIKIC